MRDGSPEAFDSAEKMRLRVVYGTVGSPHY